MAPLKGGYWIFKVKSVTLMANYELDFFCASFHFKSGSIEHFSTSVTFLEPRIGLDGHQKSLENSFYMGILYNLIIYIFYKNSH